MRKLLVAIALLCASAASATNLPKPMGNNSIVATDRDFFIATDSNSPFTAPRTLTLPPAATTCIETTARGSCPANSFTVMDLAATVNGSNTLTIIPNGTDTINGINSPIVLDTAGSILVLSPTSRTGWVTTFRNPPIGGGPGGGGGVATSRSVCVMGDSFVANGEQGLGTTNVAIGLNGFQNWLNYLAGNIRTPGTNTFGVSGDTIDNMLLRMGPVIAAGCTTVILEGGTNDITASETCSQLTSELRIMYRVFAASGISVIRPTIIPRPGSGWNAAQTFAALCTNEADRRYAEEAANRGFYLVDLDPIMTDPSQATWTIRSGYLTSDGVHPSFLGAWAYGKAIADQIYAKLAPSILRAPIQTGSDVFDATNNPSGSLLPNSMLTGTGGGVTSGCTGTSPTSFNVDKTNLPAGVSCVSSIVTLPTGQTAQQLVLTADSCAGVGLRPTMTMSSAVPTSIVAGDVIEAEAWFSVQQNGGFTGPGLLMTVTDGGIATNLNGSVGGGPDQAPLSWTGMVRTPRYTVRTGVTNVFVRILPSLRDNCGSGPLSVTLQTWGLAIRKVIP